ncbi:MAG: hypothetical protein L0215_22430 [Gemmataceae bacterium]|nr:hypothetical protein [Gemmataceae bacterium]
MAQIWKRLRGIWRKRCPRCLDGPIYEHGSKMNARCPVCDLMFERELGYFLGAMYVSYALAAMFLGTFMLVVYSLFPELDLGYTVLIAGALFLPFVPAVTRYARVIWIYFDQWAWPERKQ